VERPGGVHGRRAGVGNGVGVALVCGEEDGSVGGDGGSVANHSVDFDFPFELAIGSDGGKKGLARAIFRERTIRFEIERAVGGEGWTGELQGVNRYHIDSFRA
jgi:hypothetical protein